MAQALDIKIAGLYTDPSDLSAVPEGALTIADNIVIDRKSIAEPRRGFGYLTHGASLKTEFSDPSYRANRLFFYQSNILCHYDTGKFAFHDSANGWDNYTTTFLPITGTTVKSAVANKNFYFTTSTGVKKLDAYNNADAISMGVPPALDLVASIKGTPASTWLDNGKRVAYRLVWGIRDANGNLLLSSPSQVEDFSNSSGVAVAVEVVSSVPSGITTAHFYQLYRSAVTDVAVTPNDELGLVYEANYVSGSTITIVDYVPDALRGATIYTASSQEGIAAANQVVPLARDIAVFQSCMFYAYTTGLQNITITLLGTGTSGTALQANDTITINGLVFTAKGTETISSREFKVYTGGSSASVDIRDTALSLIRVINRYSSSTLYAYYLSGLSDLPGKIYVTSRSSGDAVWYALSSRATCWNPALQTSGTLHPSTNDEGKNLLNFSKTNQPEAVPLSNFLYVGSADEEIYRILALRDSLFVLKSDGAFRVFGTDPSNFAVSPLDYTAILLAPDSAVILNNQIFALTTQGVVMISETGVTIMSDAIESDVENLLAVKPTYLKSASFGVSYETEKSYFLWTITNAADTYPTQYYRYNISTACWTRGTQAKYCGGVNPADDKMYLGNTTAAIIDVERKTLEYSDYADYASTQTISSISSKTVSISSPDTIDVGSILYQSASVFGTVESVDILNGTVTTTLETDLTAGAVDVLAPIATKIAWVPITMGNPGASKHIREISMLFKAVFNGTAEVGFSSDNNPGEIFETITGGQVGGWGLFGWGGPDETSLGAPWGGDPLRKPIRVEVPRVCQRCSLLSVSIEHGYAYSPFQLQGFSVIGRIISERLGQ